jgi:hypothetical protein
MGVCPKLKEMISRIIGEEVWKQGTKDDVISHIMEMLPAYQVGITPLEDYNAL